MKTPLVILAALCIAAPAWAQVPAQVPAQAGAPTDQPMPPEPGQRTETDRTLDPSETDLPQADVRTRSEQEEMTTGQETRQDAARDEAPPAGSYATRTTGAGGGTTYPDMESVDNGWAELDRRRSSVTGPERAELDRTLDDLRTRREAFATRYGAWDASTATPQDRETMMHEYDMLSGDVMRARYAAADRAEFDRLVRGQFASYDSGIQQLRARFDSAAPDVRAERALQLIRARRQRDQLGLQQRALRRASEADYRTMRQTFANDLTSYDAMVRRSMMDEMEMGMNGEMRPGNMQQGGRN